MALSVITGDEEEEWMENVNKSLDEADRFCRFGQFQEAAAAAERARAVCKENESQMKEAECIIAIGRAWIELGRGGEVADLLEEAENMAQLFDKKLQADILANTVSLKLYMFEKVTDMPGWYDNEDQNIIDEVYQRTNKQALKALDIYRKLQHPSGQANALYLVTRCYYHHRDTKLALRYGPQALQYFKGSGDKAMEGKIQLLLAQIRATDGDIAVALELAHDAMSCAIAGDDRDVAGAAANLIQHYVTASLPQTQVEHDGGPGVGPQLVTVPVDDGRYSCTAISTRGR